MTGIQTTLLGQHLRIVSPLFLWLSPLALLVGAWAAVAAYRRQQRVQELLGARLAQVFPGAGAGQGVARGVSSGFGLFLLFFAVAGPKCGERTELVKRSEIGRASCRERV